MARKGSRSVNDSSQGESVKQVKKEKIKEEKLKNERVDSESDNEGDMLQEDEERKNATQGADVEDNKAEVDESVEDEDGDGSPKGRKRVRVDADGHSAPSSKDESKRKVQARTVTLPRDDDG
jgi:hypothetical protein